MGIFSSKYVTTVGTSVTRVIEDSQVPNCIRTGVIQALLQKDDQLVENMLDSMISSIGVRADKMYRYGKNTYMHGIPTSDLINSKSGLELVKAAIEEDFGEVTIDYYHYGPLNTLHYAWTKLSNDYAYTQEYNLFARPPDNMPVYLVDMVVTVKEATVIDVTNGSLEQWGISPKAGANATKPDTGNVGGHTPFDTDPNTLYDYVKVIYNYTNGITNQVVTDSFNISISGMDINTDYHHVCFIQNGVRKYWLYKAGSGEYPAIDKLYQNEYAVGGSYFPFGYFRFNKTSLVDNKNTEEYKQSKKLLNYLGMDYDVIGTAINENPDIGDVEQAMLIMAVPANTTNSMDRRYLFDYFDGVYELTKGNTPNSINVQRLAKTLDINQAKQQSIVIQDRKFKLSLTFRSITKAKKTGIVAPTGDYGSGFGTITDFIEGSTTTQTTTVKYHVYRKQITDVTYEEIRIEGLTLKYHIFGDYAETADEGEDILLIPVDMAIVRNYKISDRELLYSRSLHYVFNSRVVTKVKWYQRGVFKYITFIASFALMYFYPPAGLAALAASSGVAMAVLILITNIVLNITMGAVIKLFVKVFGAKLALVAAAVAIIYGGYQIVQAGGIAGAPNAIDLISVGNSLISTSIESDMKDLMEEYSEFQDMVKSKEELLDKAKQELMHNNYLSPMIIFGETPTEYYDRTVHSGNIGILSIDAITYYVDIALTLPKLKNSIGE